MWNKKALENRKKVLGSAYFNQEFLNIPLSKESTIVKDDWLRYYKVLPKKFDDVIMSIDPATKTSEKNDFTGITIIGEEKKM